MFKDKAYTDAAITAAEFILTKMRDKDGRLLRIYAAPPGEKPTAKGHAFLDDYAYVIHGLLNLHAATGDKKEEKPVAVHVGGGGRDGLYIGRDGGPGARTGLKCFD